MRRLFSALFLIAFITQVAFGQQEVADKSIPISTDDGSVTYPTNRNSNIIEYPFGHSQPVLKTAQLRFSRIMLQQGETINHITIAAPGMWNVKKTWQGESDKITPVILVKPRQDNISTNLVILTDKRTYDISLVAANVKDGETNPNEFFTRAISFYYPEESIGSSVQSINKEASNGKKKKQSVSYENGIINVDDADMSYNLKEGKYEFPWRPETVYNDGVHTYIKLPEDVDRLPTIKQIMPSGQRQAVNRAPNPEKNILKIDRVFDKAVLIYQFKSPGFLGIGEKTRERQLFIIRTNK
jgi:type IV secretion system protein VirB9